MSYDHFFECSCAEKGIDCPHAEHFEKLDLEERLFGTPRSGKWPAVRAKHLEKHPTCAVCGGSETLNVHHRFPVHLFPKLELEPSNLITLCESGNGGLNCHLAIGHLGSFQKYNPRVRQDARMWAKKIKDAPE